MSEVLVRPGGELASRPLHFFWMVDCSGSMDGEKIGVVNNAYRTCFPKWLRRQKTTLTRSSMCAL